MATYVTRKYECAFGHTWKDHAALKGSPPPAECPTCQAIVRDATVPPARSDVIEAPALRGARSKAVARFEDHAFKRPHFDSGAPLMTNLKDNVREGESYAVPETPRSNETMRMMVEQEQQKKIVGANPTPWGFQPVGAVNLAQTGGGAAIQVGRPSVDLKSGKRA